MNLLKPLSKATTLLCGSDYPTINKALPIYIVLMKHLKRIEHGLYDQSQLIQPATQIITKLEQYLLAALTKPVYILKRRRGSKPAAEQDTTTAIIKPRRSSPKLLLERITKNTIDSSPGEDPDLNEQNQPKGDIDCRTIGSSIFRNRRLLPIPFHFSLLKETHLHLYILAGQHTALSSLKIIRSNLQDSDL
ncbi:hypothetical protein Pst134EA_024124 [Puccinia striiformis f. sp. tritici]|uniref:hypothetical protein n=1 Tax=Puccinia striiformis f. sp. tritici TaxID=168172 RepID=UPI002008CB81|nr:hypothetical protein Pst134EA_024124 [Puccinia striiformis f. sp. tritici]KAH9453239.1 hypothetical protein Pst134EA_024124 [Puccinia striiformis f. sp. tritici]